MIWRVKLRHYEKAKKFEKISHLFWHSCLTKQLFLLSSIKTSGKFFQIFVAFSEKLNFMQKITDPPVFFLLTTFINYIGMLLFNLTYLRLFLKVFNKYQLKHLKKTLKLYPKYLWFKMLWSQLLCDHNSAHIVLRILFKFWPKINRCQPNFPRM